MPLGNLTSQFFANVYLNELDYFVKHELKVKYYIRYVDDFVILHNDKNMLEYYKDKINEFIRKNLLIELHPNKSKIIKLERGINFLGFRSFYYHKLLRRTNLRKTKRRIKQFKQDYDSKVIDYDEIYERLQGWMAYAKQANTYKLRKRLGKEIELSFPSEISDIELDRYIKNFTDIDAKHI